MATCRFCNKALNYTFVDLGLQPLSNDYLTAERLSKGQFFFPLHAYVCDACFLVQLEEFESPEAIFSDYAYFSSFSSSWLEHAQAYSKVVIQRFGLNAQSQVIEIASNDGYLLQYFHTAGIPVLGIEPASNVAHAAIQKGIPTAIEFFGVQAAKAKVSQGIQADLLIGNNVLAHVPDINDFVAGLKIILKPSGVITMEFPHVLKLIKNHQFDTIYHEHFSYLSLLTVEKIFAAHGLVIFDVEELSTHGGSLRIFACHAECENRVRTERIHTVLNVERQENLHNINTYMQFNREVWETKQSILRFLLDVKAQDKTVVGYGAPAKGNTLLNYCGVRTDFLDFTVDINPHKQGHFLPGSLIPIYAPEAIFNAKPDYVFILPWNIKDEIIQQMTAIRAWGGRFVVPIPKMEVLA